MNRMAVVGMLSVVVSLGCRSAQKPPATTRSVTTQAASPRMTIDQAMNLIETRDSWRDYPPISVPRHPAEHYLKGLCIVIDPGHGGKDHNGKGPTGILEADMNLRVGLLLKKLLDEAGAYVVLTRSDDRFLELADRAKIANDLARPDGGVGADLFISVHHNSTQGRTTNWTSVWYHGSVDDAEVGIDAAKFVALNLSKAIRTDAGVTSPLFSDQLMYPGGFGMLRACDVPCFLCECSFYSNPAEEQRLADAGYNLREAYAIYVGLCEWAQCGRPHQTAPTIKIDGSSRQLESTLSEGLPDWWGKDRSRILESSIEVKMNGKEIPHHFDPATKVLTADLPLPADAGSALVEIHFANMFGNHNWPQRFECAWGQGESEAKVKTLGSAPAKATTRALTHAGS